MIHNIWNTSFEDNLLGLLEEGSAIDENRFEESVLIVDHEVSINLIRLNVTKMHVFKHFTGRYLSFVKQLNIIKKCVMKIYSNSCLCRYIIFKDFYVYVGHNK